MTRRAFALRSSRRQLSSSARSTVDWTFDTPMRSQNSRMDALVYPRRRRPQGRHARIIPAGDVALLHELTELALGHDGVIDTERCELNLSRLDAGNGDVRHDPVIKRAVILILKRAEASA